MMPVLFELGPITFYSYGAMIALAYLVSSTLLARHGKRIGYKSEDLSSLAFVVLMGGMVGGRLYYVGLHLPHFAQAWHEVFFVFEGGLVLHGALAGMLLTLFLYCKWKGWKVLPTLDLIIPYVALAQCFGRWGCYLNGCCYGKLGIPIQLVNSLGLMLLAVVLVRMSFKVHAVGQVFYSYLVGYGLMRFHTEFLRGDQVNYFIGLTHSQWVSLVFVLLGVVLIMRNKKVT